MSVVKNNQSRNPTLIMVIIIAVALSIILVAVTVKAAHQVQRPITGGAINQTYLWTNETIINGQVYYHKGVDFSAGTGTNVYSASEGTVVDMREDLVDDDHTTLFGNFILIQHSTGYRHWDQTNGSGGGVSQSYSMYLHLRHDSVVPNVGDQVSAGDLIARSGNTGNSTGPHLHFQIVLHPDAGASLEPDTLQSGNRSRNPELWLTPLAGTGTAIGKVSDSNGNPVQNLVVCGLVKDTPGYTSSRTYSFPWANPDDILRENFGTTDVRPGTYYMPLTAPQDAAARRSTL